MKQHSSSGTLEPVKTVPPRPPVLEIHYKFKDWTGNEDVLYLPQLYANELENAVKDGDWWCHMADKLIFLKFDKLWVLTIRIRIHAMVTD